LRRIRDCIVDLIRSVSHVTQDSIGLLDQIDLEAYVIDNVSALPWNGHNRDEVDERDAAASVVDQRGLALFAGVEHPLQVSHSDVIGVLSLRALDDFSIGTLRKLHS
jgi:hypothetical protein